MSDKNTVPPELVEMMAEGGEAGHSAPPAELIEMMMSEPQKMADGGAPAPVQQDVGQDFSQAPEATPEAPAEAQIPQGLMEAVEPDLQEAKYGSPEQVAKTAAEGLGKGIAGPVAGFFEKNLGVKPEDIRGRQEANHVTHGVAEAAGLIGSGVAGVGEGALLNAVEKAVPAAAAEAPTIARVGSTAAKLALSNLAYQMTDEAHKMVLNDPEQTTDTALANMGYSALFGGALGATGAGLVSPLWKATKASKLGHVLGLMSDRAGGIEGVVPDNIMKAAKMAGVDVPPEVMAAIGGDPVLSEYAHGLMNTDTNASGKAMQEAMTGFRKRLGELSAESLGFKTEEALDAKLNRSDAAYGSDIGQKAAARVKAATDPMTETFENFNDSFKEVPLDKDLRVAQMAQPEVDAILQAHGLEDLKGTPLAKMTPYTRGLVERSLESQTRVGTTTSLMDNMQKAAIDNSWTGADPMSSFVNNIIKDVSKADTVEALRNIQTKYNKIAYGNVLDNTMHAPWHEMNSLLDDAIYGQIEKKLGEINPGAVDYYKALKANYREQSEIQRVLKERLGAKKVSTAGFGDWLEKMSVEHPEVLLKRLGTKTDSYLYQHLTKHFPEVAQALKDYHLDKLVGTSVKNGEINLGTLRKNLLDANKTPPELRNFLASPQALQTIEGASTLLDAANKMPTNFSNTARTSYSLMRKLPGTAIGMMGTMMGHNPIGSFVMGSLVEPIGKNIPDAARLSLLKFLGTSAPVNPSAFKSMAEFINHTLKGESAMAKGAKAVFNTAVEMTPARGWPKEKDLDRLDDRLKQIQTNPSILLKLGQDTAQYMPQESQKVAAQASAVANYLNSKRPEPKRTGPLDKPIEPTAAENAAFRRTLEIAENPLVVLKHIKEGTLTPTDIADLKATHPGAQQRIAQKVMAEMVETVKRGDSIPYHTKMALSMFMGQPLDSTMTPQAIQTMQQSLMPTPLAPPPKMGTPSKMQPGKAAKSSSMFQTSQQAGEARRVGR